MVLLKEQQFDVGGMTCAACQANVEKCVLKLDGVKNVDVSLLSNSMKVEYDEDKVDEDKISLAVENIGYSASAKGKKKKVKVLKRSGMIVKSEYRTNKNTPNKDWCIL